MPGPRPLSGENAMRRIGIPNVLAALTLGALSLPLQGCGVLLSTFGVPARAPDTYVVRHGPEEYCVLSMPGLNRDQRTLRTVILGNPSVATEESRLLFSAAPETDWIAIDRAGHGHSTRREEPSPVDQARALFTIADGRAGGRKHVLVVASWSAGIAYYLARQHPDRIAGVVLLGPEVVPDPSLQDCWAALLDVWGLGPLLAETIGAPWARWVSVPGQLDLAVGQDSTGQPWCGIRDRCVELVSRPSNIRAMVRDEAAMLDFLRRFTPQIAAIDVPMVCLVGDRDHIVPVDRHAGALESLRPETRSFIVPGAGYQLHWTHPEVVAGAVRYVEALAGLQPGAEEPDPGEFGLPAEVGLSALRGVRPVPY